MGLWYIYHIGTIVGYGIWPQLFMVHLVLMGVTFDSFVALGLAGLEMPHCQVAAETSA